MLAATAVRAYEPVIRYDWPSIRGLDHFSHALMAQQMLGHGSYRSYLIYPPGFPAVSAVLSRLSGLPPLVLYPVIAPALLVLTALAVYVLATRLWGWGYGIAAAALSGLVLHGAYGSLADGRYPDLTSAYFLITMGVAALLTLYASPSRRSAALAAVLGASPILYHSVATLYEALILVLAAVTSLPYLLYLRRRTEARTVLAGLAGARGARHWLRLVHLRRRLAGGRAFRLVGRRVPGARQPVGPGPAAPVLRPGPAHSLARRARAGPARADAEV